MKIEDSEILIVVPARFGSSRFPGKPLAMIGGEPLVLRVCRRCRESGFPVVVATDSSEVAECVGSFGFKAILSHKACNCGTERVWDAVSGNFPSAKIIVNIQCDEAMITADEIHSLVEALRIDSDKEIKNLNPGNYCPSVGIATLIRKFDKNEGFEALFSPDLVKVVVSDNGEALYFSRSIIPYVRDYKWQEWLEKTEFHTHIGAYAYHRETLKEIAVLTVSSLEKSERLEQLRWLQNGFRIMTVPTSSYHKAIDREEDLTIIKDIICKEDSES